MNRQSIPTVAVLIALLSLALQSTPAFCGETTVSQDEGVTIKRNADGSLEVFDTPQGQADGKRSEPVAVKRNADGSMEVYDVPVSQVAESQPRPVFEVSPVVRPRPIVTTRKPLSSTKGRTWSSGISAI
jgi:hypothetical protein